MLEYLESLDVSAGEFLGMMWKQGGTVSTAVLSPPMVDTFLQYQIPTGADVYLAPNPVAGPVRMNDKTLGRGTEDSVTRVAALYADLDVKPGACPDLDTAMAIIDDISIILEERPVATIFSGGGLQPLWALDDCAPGLGKVLLRRFGRLVRTVADARNVKVDSVFDMARVLRVPGTMNYKYDPPVAAAEIPGTGAPMDPVTVAERLEDMGIYELPEDTGLGSDVILDPVDCQWASATCGYMKRTISQWAFDNPMARHPWLLSQFVRLEAAHRYSCLTKLDYDLGVAVLTQKFGLLCAREGDARVVKRYEVRDIRIEARSRTSRKTDAQIAIELGSHPHLLSAPMAPGPVLAPSLPANNGSALLSAPVTGGSGPVRLRSLSQFRTDTPVWAWTYDGRGRIQLGTFTLFAGRPGAGKSTAARWFAAQYSIGGLDGCFKGSPVNVAYISPAEESHEYVIVPGLLASGADPERIVTPEVFDPEGNSIRILSARDEVNLVNNFRDNGIRVVVVDPLMSTLPGQGVDINKNNEARLWLEPWARIAQAIDGIVFGVVHLTKHPGADLVAAINGSSAFGEIARGVFGFVKDRHGERVLSQVKNSAGYEDLSLTYDLTTTNITVDSGNVGEISTFAITGRSELTAADAMLADAEEGISLTKTDFAVDWLREELERMGRVRSKDILNQARNDEGISKNTLYRAAKKLSVAVSREDNPPKSYWRLPGDNSRPSEGGRWDG